VGEAVSLPGASEEPAASGLEAAAPLLGRSSSRAHLKAEEDRRFRPEVYWYLSFRCNLACAHCSVFSSPEVDTSADLDTEQALQVVEQLAELGARQVMLTGGEALLPRASLRILEALGEAGIAVSLESNGISFGVAFAALARRLQERRLLNIGVSLDGGTAESHERVRGPRSFSRTLAGLRFLKEQGVAFSIQCVLNRVNYVTIPELYEIAAGLRPQLHAVGFGFLNPVGRGVDLVQDLGIGAAEMPLIMETIKRAKAGFDGLTVVKSPPAAIPPKYLAMVFRDPSVTHHVTCSFPLFGVLPNGDVTICGLSREDEELHFGNVMTHRLADIWANARMDELRRRYVAADSLGGICSDCIFKYSCKGGCRAWAYEQGRSFDAALPVCSRLAEAGEFPDAYRISAQRRAIEQGRRALRVVAEPRP